MSLSTSSSDPPPDPSPGSVLAAGGRAVVEAGTRMLGVLTPTVGFALAAWFGMALAADLLPPHDGTRDLERIIVREQLRRANVIRPEVLVVGDSSALMGVDARRLSRALGRRVESLATLAWVGPAGYGRLVSLASRGGPSHPTAVVVLMCGSSLSLEEYKFRLDDYEQQVLATEASSPTDFPAQRAADAARLRGRRVSLRPRQLARWRNRIYDRVFLPFVDPPLPGRLGFYYGWPKDIAVALERGQGTMVDPALPNPGRWPARYQFDVSTAVGQRLSVLARSLHEDGVEIASFGITPIPDSAVGAETAASRERTLANCVEALQLPSDAALVLPLSLPAEKFATFSHLNAAGRQEYTDLLAQALVGRTTTGRARGTGPPPGATAD